MNTRTDIALVVRALLRPTLDAGYGSADATAAPRTRMLRIERSFMTICVAHVTKPDFFASPYKSTNGCLNAVPQYSYMSGVGKALYRNICPDCRVAPCRAP
jgi:hypothetical protein